MQKVSHVFLSEGKSYYSVPHRYIGQYVEVQYTADMVEVFFNAERIASHRRSLRPGCYSTAKEHVPSSHQAYSDWSPEYFEKRAGKVGDFTARYISRLISQYSYPEVACKQAQGILSLLKCYAAERLEKACKRAWQYRYSSYRTIERILKNNLDQQEDAPNIATETIPVHENIRGAAYYQ